MIVIVGPTASGKSAFGVALARAVGGEILSADSRQVYKGLDIGTGKIAKREMKNIPHHGLDLVSAKRTYTAHDFVKMGRRTIEEISKRGKVPIIVGGTGFYIDALVGRIELAEVPTHKKLRKTLDKKSARELFVILQKLDPERAEIIDRNNPVRLIRAIEIARVLGKNPPLYAHELYDTYWIGLRPDMNDLRKKIGTRLVTRMRSGMVHEAKRLHHSGLSYARMEALGLEYRSLARFLKGAYTKQEMLRELETKIWHYARRQCTYWRRNKDIHWVAPKDILVTLPKVHTYLGRKK